MYISLKYSRFCFVLLCTSTGRAITNELLMNVTLSMWIPTQYQQPRLEDLT